MNLKSKLFLLLISILLLGGVYGQADGPGFKGPGYGRGRGFGRKRGGYRHGRHRRGPGKGYGHRLARMKEHLGLNEAQEKKIKSIMLASRQTANNIFLELEEVHLKVRKELNQTKPSLKKLEKYLDEEAALEKKLKLEMLQRDLKIRQVLSAQQLKKWLVRHQFRGKKRGHRGRRGWWPGCRRP
jgi:Spy/CpxP family protein refolding chaperone